MIQTPISQPAELRKDLALIADMIEPGSRVLDIGCGRGELLQHLFDAKNIDARGIELSQAGVNLCVSQGLSVVQGDADTDLINYPEKSFDVVILSQTIQATQKPRIVLEQMMRIGRKVIISIPNFGYWRVRLQLLIKGTMPLTESLPESWYDTPNIHFCTIRDFENLCSHLDVSIEKELAVDSRGYSKLISSSRLLMNFFGEKAIFVLTSNEPSGGEV